MTTYLITYHLNHHQHGQDDNLSRKIKSLGSWGQIMPSTWVIVSSMTSEEITHSLKEFLEPKELLFVSKLTNDNFGILPSGALPWIDECVKKVSI
ncbi:hypothetical protein UT300005_22560 [Clostridium sp. CTA-5]